MTCQSLKSPTDQQGDSEQIIGKWGSRLLYSTLKKFMRNKEPSRQMLASLIRCSEELLVETLNKTQFVDLHPRVNTFSHSLSLCSHNANTSNQSHTFLTFLFFSVASWRCKWGTSCCGGAKWRDRLILSPLWISVGSRAPKQPYWGCNVFYRNGKVSAISTLVPSELLSFPVLYRNPCQSKLGIWVPSIRAKWVGKNVYYLGTIFLWIKLHLFWYFNTLPNLII